MMKKLIVLLSLVFMYSCSSDESQDGMSIDGGYNINAKINPPQWIQGTWIDSKGQIFEFTKSDITCNSYGNLYSAKGEVQYYIIQDEDPEITQTQTDDSYILQYKNSASSKRTYSFVKISDTELESKGAFKGIYTKK